MTKNAPDFAGFATRASQAKKPTPPLPRDWQRRWAADFQRAYEALCADVDAGRETAIDPYAAESPEEFFAVCTEHHFSDAATLQAAMPDVAAHLRRFYGAALLG